MNYGKKKASQKQKKITSKSTMQGKRVGVRLFKAFLLCLIVVGLAGVIGGGVFVKRILDDTPEVSPADVKPSGYTTFVYADDGATEIQRFVASGSNRVYKTLDQIPEYLQHAFIAIEDERFYDHNGIDLQGIARAAVVGLTSGNFSEGASTLTQQLIKNNVFPEFTEEKTFYDKLQRKIQEQYLALQIEQQMSKEEILEAYLNTINLGQNSLGVQSAAQRYFGKDVSELTLSESAVIAAITQSPSGYNPVTNPESNATRRQKVLDNMLEQGYIDQAAYDEALADDVYARIQQVNTQVEAQESSTSYFVDALADQVMTDLQDQLGYSESQAYNALYSGGLSIYSTQNLAMQAICDEEMNDDGNYPGLKEYGLDYALTVTRADGTVENYSSGHIKNYVRDTYGDDQGLLYSSEDDARAMVEEWKSTIAQEGDTYDERITITPQPQASVTIMDQATGQIKAMVGGRGAKTNLGLNRAYQGATRQPGSCFKILAAYAPALDACGKTLATIVRDEPYTYKTGKQVQNASRSYKGDVTYRTAIANSINVCAVKVSDEITQELGYEYCEDFGISTLVKDKEINGAIYSDVNQTLALGGVTEGVYNYQMCAAYATIANGGVYNSPTLYTKIVDHDGNVLLENNQETRTVLKDSTAALLTSAMETVVTSGTGTSCQLDNMPVAGKTGTTTSNKDLWFCGYTPYYTCAVWGGYDDNKECNYDTSFRFRLWRGIMSRIHENLEYKDFTMPASVEQKTVCTLTGKLAVAGQCPSITEYFATDTAPTESCSGHGGVVGGGGGSSDSSDSGDTGDTGATGTTGGAVTGGAVTGGDGTTGGGNAGGGDTGGDNTGGGDTGGGDTGGGDTGGGNTGGGDTGGGNTGGGDTGGGDTGGGTGQ